MNKIKQLKLIIDRFFDDWEAPSQKVYSEELAKEINRNINWEIKKIVNL